MNIEFVARLKLLFEHYKLTASQFADEIGVTRSSMSHLVSGRNKPSLDFILKVVGQFPEVNLYWLLNGKGTFPSKVEEENKTPTLTKSNTKSGNNIKNTPSTTTSGKQPKATIPIKKVIQVICFYEDGTFDTYYPDK